MAFKYRRPSQENLEKRSERSGGDFESFIKNDFKTYKVRKGDNHIRILPPTWEDPENDYYGFDVFVHYGVGPEKASVICPYKTAKQPCPVCEERQKLERSGASDEELREYRASQRVLVWLIDRKDEDLGPMIWAMPFGLSQDIVKCSKDKTTGSYFFIDDPDDGNDLFFDKEGEGKLTKYKGIQVSHRSSSVDVDWLDFIADNPLPDLLVIRDYDEINALFTGGQSEQQKDERPRRSRDREDDDRGRERERDRESSRGRDRDDSERREPEPDNEDDPPFEGGRDTRTGRERDRNTDDDPGEAEAVGRRKLEPRGGRQPESDPKTDEPPSGKSRADILKERFKKR